MPNLSGLRQAGHGAAVLLIVIATQPVRIGNNCITADDIELLPSSNIVDLLAREANLNLRSTLGNAKFSGVDIRGQGDAYSSNVQVLVDGIRLNAADLSGADYSSVPLDQIERVEVIRGANSVRYGNGAIRVNGFNRAGMAFLEIHDNGPGVPKPFEEAIWEGFERGAHPLDAIIPGSGVGLPISRTLVEAHHGKIIQKRPEILGGACFVVSLPLSLQPGPVTSQPITTAASARVQ